jgi:radical SAM protein with 4Fe4S-binding SPASM domain
MRARPFYSPPSYILRQAASLLLYARLVRWPGVFTWMVRGIRALRVAAGSRGMGCIGFPVHPVWEVTARCNLHCKHCHVSAGSNIKGELSTGEGRDLIDQIAAIDEFRMLAITGGEPMLREDILDLVAHAHNRGLEIVIASNGYSINPPMAKRLRRLGVAGLAISLDGSTPGTHDRLRASDGAFEMAVEAARSCVAAGLVLQINITITRHSLHDLEAILDLAQDLRASIVLVYHLIPCGRGEEISDIQLDTEQYRQFLEILWRKQRSQRYIIEAVCSPQYWSVLLKRRPRPPSVLRFAQNLFHGCVAGWGMCYIKSDGEVWACPFMPLSVGNVKRASLQTLWRESPLFKDLRMRDLTLSGRCGRCDYRALCGGCRSRAYAHWRDPFAEDPLCFIEAPMFSSLDYSHASQS